MPFLLDTNILSELRKGTRCNPNVSNWAAKEIGQAHYISVLSLGEIRKGIELLKKNTDRLYSVRNLAAKTPERLRELHHCDYKRNRRALGRIFSTTPTASH
jgi:predicted nucleic acid-binding protein